VLKDRLIVTLLEKNEKRRGAMFEEMKNPGASSGVWTTPSNQGL
jgi:hypothetical protein